MLPRHELPTFVPPSTPICFSMRNLDEMVCFGIFRGGNAAPVEEARFTCSAGKKVAYFGYDWKYRWPLISR